MSDSTNKWLIERTDTPGIYWSGLGLHSWARNPDYALSFADAFSAERILHHILKDNDAGSCRVVEHVWVANSAGTQQCSGQTIDGRASHPVVETCGEPAPHSSFGPCMLAKGHQPAAVHEHACLSCVALEEQIDRIMRKLRIERVEFRDRERLLNRAVERVRSILNTVGDTSDLLHRLTNL